MKNRVGISDGNTEKQLKEQKIELESQEKSSKTIIDTSRKRLQGRDQKDYIIDWTQHPDVIEAGKAIVASRTREIIGSSNEINLEKGRKEKKIKKVKSARIPI